MSHVQRLQTAKTALRREIKQRLKAVNQNERSLQSHLVTQKVLAHPFYKQSRAVAVFLSMPDEIDTSSIVENIFASGKQCYVPRYNEDGMNFMTMVQVKSFDDLRLLPKTKWNIPQPERFETDDDCLATGNLDLILTPGLAFTENGHRLGRGKGFYDNFLNTYFGKFGKVKTLGLALRECIVDDIPVSEKDILIDEIVHA